MYVPAKKNYVSNLCLWELLVLAHSIHVFFALSTCGGFVSAGHINKINAFAYIFVYYTEWQKASAQGHSFHLSFYRLPKNSFIQRILYRYSWRLFYTEWAYVFFYRATLRSAVMLRQIVCPSVRPWRWGIVLT